MNWAVARDIALPTPHGALPGRLVLPEAAQGLIVVARTDEIPLADLGRLAAGRFGVLDLELLAAPEREFPDMPYNVPLLTQRLLDLLAFVRADGDTEALPLGLLAGAHAAPAAIRAAARRDAQVRALACWGGLIDLAGRQYLDLLAAPVLVLAEAGDAAAARSFEHAAPHLAAPHRLQRLTADDDAAEQLAAWFGEHL